MTSWPELKPMKNNLVNYGVTENGIAIIELCSDSAGEPLTEGKTSVNTYTREMWHDIDDAILSARFDDSVSVILITGHGEKFFSAGATLGLKVRLCTLYFSICRRAYVQLLLLPDARRKTSVRGGGSLREMDNTI